jgi:hypothetical protein
MKILRIIVLLMIYAPQPSSYASDTVDEKTYHNVKNNIHGQMSCLEVKDDARYTYECKKMAIDSVQEYFSVLIKYMTFKSFDKEKIKSYISKYEEEFQEYEWKEKLLQEYSPVDLSSEEIEKFKIFDSDNSKESPEIKELLSFFQPAVFPFPDCMVPSPL